MCCSIGAAMPHTRWRLDAGFFRTWAETLWRDGAELGQMRAQCIDYRPLKNEQIARPVHIRTAFLTGTNRIEGLVTASQIAAASAMSQRDQLTRPMMRRRAGLHADETRFLITEEIDGFRTAQPSLDDALSSRVGLARSRPIVITCMADGPLRCGVHRRRRTGTSMPGAEAVHPIKTFAIVVWRIRSDTVPPSSRGRPSVQR
jgi:hypothetical protein